MDWTVTELPHLSGCTVEWAEEGSYILSRRNVLLHSTDLNGPFSQIAVIDASVIRAIASRMRLFQRLLRFMATNVVPVGDREYFVTFDKSIGIVRDGRYITLNGLARPCRVLRSACAIDRNGDIYFGEYLANEDRGPMNIYRYKPGNEIVETAFTFSANTIRHIHGVYFDSFTDSLICLTGDAEAECKMLRSYDGFRSMEPIGEGDESWRAVSLLFTNTGIIYGTDAEYRSNEIFEIDRASGRRRSIGNVSGTVFYSKKLGSDLFFATTAENAPSQEENVAAIYHINDERQCREVARFSKDRWHKTLFMLGTIHFPYENKFENKLFFSVVAAKGDNKTFCLSRQEA
jgi:hypothetical protein